MKENAKFTVAVFLGCIIVIGGGVLALISFVSKRWLLMILGILLFLAVILFFIWYGIRNRIPFVVRK